MAQNNQEVPVRNTPSEKQQEKATPNPNKDKYIDPNKNKDKNPSKE